MFYIDGVSLSKIKEELKNDLVGKRINRITKNTETSLSIYFGKIELVFSCNASFPICYITNSKEGVLEQNSGLVANMKKHLLNAMLTGIEQLGFDRILVFKFSRINELGEVKKFDIYFELMGKYSNFIVTDENAIIIDVLKRFSLEENRLRALFPGLPYEQPIIEKKISPLEIDSSQFENYYNSNTLLKEVEGIGKLFVKSINSYEEYEKLLNGKMVPKVYLKNKRIVLATVLDITPSGEYNQVVEFDTFRELVNYYIENNNLSGSFDTLKTIVLSAVLRKIKKNEKIIEVLKKEKIEKQDFEKYKEQGDILASCMYSVKKGMDKVSTYDFYNNCMIDIPLEVQLTPQQNLEKIYKKYNKLKRGIEANEKRYAEITQELEYLNGLKLFIETSETLDNLKLIQEELIAQGYIKKPKNSKNKKSVKTLNYGVIEKDGYTILYGRNNMENDNLTFKVADKEDIWLHAKDIPGSHVIIKASEINDDILFEGAKVAAFYSKGNIGDKISVDYTKKRYINKPKGGKPGFVTYINEKNILVEKVEI